MTEPAVPARRAGLMAALIAVALLVYVASTAQTVQVMAGVGARLSWRTIALTQGAFALGWILWALVLVRLMPRRPPAAALALLVVLPAALVPAFAVPFHKLLLQPGTGWPASWAHIAGHNLLTNLLLGAAMVALAWGYLHMVRARALEVSLANAQLDTLRAQLDPHFLFNTLNSVAVLARRGDGEAVATMVTGLAELLRQSLASSRAQVVSLGSELAALRQYLAIEAVRFGERLRVTIDVPEALHGLAVPSFLLQPLAENALRHGWRDASSSLELKVSGAVEGGRLTLSLADDGIGTDASAEGLGLGNTRARLAGLYGNRASLSLARGVNGGTTVIVTLPAS